MGMADQFLIKINRKKRSVKNVLVNNMYSMFIDDILPLPKLENSDGLFRR